MRYPKKPLILTGEKFEKTIKRYPLVVMMCLPNMELTFGNPEPVMNVMAEKYEGKVVFGIIDIEKNKGIASHYDITNTPVFLIFNNTRLVGYLKNNGSKKDLDEKIEQNL